MRSYLLARKESAEKQLERVRELGDPSWEESVEAELEARTLAYERFEDRTMSRSPAAIAVGGTLIGLGFAGVALGSSGIITMDFPEDRSDRGRALALLIGGVALMGAGVPLLVVGLRKTWNGPPDDARTAPRVVVGAGRFTVQGRF